MKKVLLSLFMVTLFTMLYNKVVLAENLSYPFDSITIVEAKKFDILIPANVPEGSLLYGKVEAGDTVTVYVASIQMKDIGSQNSSESVVLILADETENDIIRYIINNYLTDLEVFVNYQFASHILIDSTMGVYKDMELIDNMQQITVHHILSTNTLTLTDNAGLEIPMIPNSYELQTDLEIVISVNTRNQEGNS